MAKKTYLEKLGLEPVARLNKTICKKRASFIRRNIRQGTYKGKLLERAKYYARWYAWAAETDLHGERRAA